MARPEPPQATDSIDDLVSSIQQSPSDWLLYLRNSYRYTLDQEGQVKLLRTAIEAERKSAAVDIAERDGIIRFQKEQYEAAQQEIKQLAVEKAQLAAAATPTVLNPAGNVPDASLRPPTSTPVSNSGSDRLSEKIPDPREFDGTRNDLRRFTQQIYGKMTANTDRFSNATARLTYVAGRLTGRAYELILPKTAFGIPQFIDYPELLEYLEKAFGDPDRVQNAQNKLFSLKQKAQDFSVYFSEFQRLALEGEMPESALTPLLFQGISRELQDMLLHNPAPSNAYTAYANHLQMLDNRYRQHQQQASRNRNPPPAKSPSFAATIGRASPAPVRPEQSNSPRLVGPSRTTTPDPDLMDLSHASHRYPNGRRERGECFRCGSKDHRVAQCPEPDNRPAIQGRASHLYRPESPPTSGPSTPPGSITGQLNGVSLN
jgi:hypothetical protein